ncbi:MAG: hypothetical protein ABI885_04600, partial [Gammaproteobacteria bacterium]
LILELAAMFTTSTIEESLEHLLNLSAFLAAEVGSTTPHPTLLPPATKVLKEALLTTQVLISKLEVARSVHAEATWPQRICSSCED